jgi:hypothetical protein
MNSSEAVFPKSFFTGKCLFLMRYSINNGEINTGIRRKKKLMVKLLTKDYALML